MPLFASVRATDLALQKPQFFELCTTDESRRRNLCLAFISDRTTASSHSPIANVDDELLPADHPNDRPSRGAEAAQRAADHECARAALKNELCDLRGRLTESEITQERLSFEAAIREIEA